VSYFIFGSNFTSAGLFSIFFTVRFSNKFLLKVVIAYAATPHSCCYATLWKMFMLKNRDTLVLSEVK